MSTWHLKTNLVAIIKWRKESYRALIIGGIVVFWGDFEVFREYPTWALPHLYRSGWMHWRIFWVHWIFFLAALENFFWVHWRIFWVHCRIFWMHWRMFWVALENFFGCTREFFGVHWRIVLACTSRQSAIVHVLLSTLLPNRGPSEI